MLITRLGGKHIREDHCLEEKGKNSFPISTPGSAMFIFVYSSKGQGCFKHYIGKQEHSSMFMQYIGN